MNGFLDTLGDLWDDLPLLGRCVAALLVTWLVALLAYGASVVMW